MDGKTQLADFYAGRARVSLAACLDRPSEICVSALLCLAYYLMGVAGDGDTSQARLLIALANEMVDVLLGGPLVRHSVSQQYHQGAASAASGDSKEGGSAGTDYKPSPLSRAYSKVPLDIVLTAHFLGQLNTVPRGNPLHLRSGSRKPAASSESPARQLGGSLKRNDSAESQASMVDDAAAAEAHDNDANAEGVGGDDAPENGARAKEQGTHEGDDPSPNETVAADFTKQK